MNYYYHLATIHINIHRSYIYLLLNQKKTIGLEIHYLPGHIMFYVQGCGSDRHHDLVTVSREFFYI